MAARSSSTKIYQYFQPNKKDVKDKFGDCTIRALCKALDKEWIEVFDLLIPYEREFQCPFSGFTLEMQKPVFEALGFEYQGISNAKGSKRPTVESFTKSNKSGVFVLNVAHHLVAVVDGKYYDTWDCGHKSLYGYFKKI